MSTSDRRIRINFFGLVLILALAAYSLLCLFVSTYTLSCYSMLEITANVASSWLGGKNYNKRTIYQLTNDSRPFKITLWSKVIGIANYMMLNASNTCGEGLIIEIFKYGFYISICCFILASLLQSYVALRALLQPSYAAGRNGSDVKKQSNHNILNILTFSHIF